MNAEKADLSGTQKLNATKNDGIEQSKHEIREKIHEKIVKLMKKEEDSVKKQFHVSIEEILAMEAEEEIKQMEEELLLNKGEEAEEEGEEEMDEELMTEEEVLLHKRKHMLMGILNATREDK